MKPIYKIMFFVSISLVILAIVAIAVFGLRLGVDFKGGSLIEIKLIVLNDFSYYAVKSCF